jgi:catechol 2,3-dioxygenase-like lactoylglutathione lyase family enzyme
VSRAGSPGARGSGKKILVKLAKPHVDVGLATNRLEPMLSFWQEEVGLRFEEVLPLGGGRRQHRHTMNGSVLKLNHARDPLPERPPSGYRELWIARDDLAARRELSDPDGNRVVLLPRGESGVTGIAVRLGVRDEAAFHAFYRDALQLEPARGGAYRCGDSLLWPSGDRSASGESSMDGGGYRYVTIQVWDVDAEHAGILARGGRQGMAPRTLGDVARISFVRDPDGNWIEISQRRSLTGSVAPAS